MNNHQLQNLKQNLREIISESSLSTKVLLSGSLLFYPFSLLLPSLTESYFTIHASKILPPNFWIWTLLTYPFVENSIIALASGLICIVIASRLLEPLWGNTELAKFLIVSCIGAGVLSGFGYLFIYCLTLNEEFLYSRYFHGLVAIKGAVLVGLKQTRGEDFLLKTPMLSVQINQVPFILLAVFWGLSGVTGLISTEYCTLFSAGIYAAWFYLRFYQHHQRGQGDLADHFALSTFFPRPLNRFVKVASLPPWQLAVRFGFCKKQVGSTTGTRSGYQPVNIALPDAGGFDAERRRQKALQQLND